MQRVAIFKFNWGQRLALSLVFIISILLGALFVYNTNTTHAASDTTYKTESSDNLIKKVKAIKYYSALSYCTSSISAGKFKTTISGGDIDKGPRWWINSGGTVLLGQYIDTWGDKDGTSGCNGESDDSPGWIEDMFSVFGLSTASGSAGKVDALKGLGYDCSKNGSDWSCTNNDINSSTSKKGLLYQALHGPYLNGVNPLTTQPDFNAMSYVVAMDALTTTSMCKASKGGSSNLVTVSQVQPDGSIVKGDWAVKNDGGPGRRVPAGLPLDQQAPTRGGLTTTNITCQGAADDTVSFAGDYQKWVAGPACAAAHPEEADNASFMTGCTYGRIHPTDYAGCLSNTFTSNRAVDTTAQDACFIGQGLPVDVNGVPSGRLCAAIPTYASNASLLTACIKGSLNRTLTYCQSTYPAPDQIPNRPTQPDTNSATRAACIFGVQLKVTGGGVPQDAGASGVNSSNDTNKTSCGVDGIGWIVCPVISFMGDLLANAFSGLADNFLATDTGLFDTTSGTYTAWSVFRTFANIAFVIVFLIIIFSQLTGVGVSNYGVKKLLPRIVIAAILVNVSYFICQIAVDLSNILGYSLKNVFDAIAVQANVPTSTDASGNGFGIAAIIVGVIATATVAYFALSILIPVLLGALVGVLMVVLMLIARKAIIVLLIVLSPLAFVAFLLPNTESLFTKWRKAFMALLLLFPIISVVFGMSSLASQIVLQAGPGTGSADILKIMSVGIAALPFFLVPTLLKGSLNGIGTVGGKLTSFANKAGGSLGKAGGKGLANSRLGQFQAYRSAERNKRRALIQSGVYEGKGGKLNPRNLASRANKAFNDSAVSGKFGDRNAATGISMAEKLDTEEVAAAETLLRNRNPNPTELIGASKKSLSAAIKSGDTVAARAAQNVLLNSGGKGISELHETLSQEFAAPGSKDSEVGKSLRTALNRAGLKPKNNALASWAYNDQTIGEASSSASSFEKLSDAELGGHSIKNLRAANSAGILDAARAKRMLESPVVAAQMGEEERQFVQKLVADGGLTVGPSSNDGTPPKTPPSNPNGGSGPGGLIVPGDNNFNIPH